MSSSARARQAGNNKQEPATNRARHIGMRGNLVAMQSLSVEAGARAIPSRCSPQLEFLSDGADTGYANNPDTTLPFTNSRGWLRWL